MPTAQFAPADLAAILSFAVSGCRAEHPEVEIALDISGKLPEMLLDAEQIRGVILNLLNNAIAAVEGEAGKKSIQVKAWFDRYVRRAIVEVIDNGPGIPAADKNRVFEPYFTTKKGGTGLGLAIVSSVISDHQGEVRIFDNVPRGVRFVVTLPQHPQPSTLRKLVAG
jgi:two-component system nitrogen regulation sensor histidine kinase NtrY